MGTYIIVSVGHIREKLGLEVLWREWASFRESYKVGLKITNAM